MISPGIYETIFCLNPLSEGFTCYNQLMDFLHMYTTQIDIFRNSYSLLQVILFVAVGVILVILAIKDIKTKEISDYINLAIFFCGIIAIWITPQISLISRLIGIFVVSVPLLLITMLIADAFGGGDIKMMAACGFLLGWKGVIVAACIGIILGGFYGAILLIRKDKKKTEHFAFGPFLAMGVFAALLWGEDIISRYMYYM